MTNSKFQIGDIVTGNKHPFDMIITHVVFHDSKFKYQTVIIDKNHNANSEMYNESELTLKKD